MAVTLDELELRVRAILDEPTAGQWQQDNLRRWFNEGLRDLARTTRHWKSTATQNATAGTSEYTQPSSILAIEHAYYDDGSGNLYPLTAAHYESMDNVWGAHQNRAGRPEFFTTKGSSPALKLKVWPVPTVTHAGPPTSRFQMNTVILPTEMPLSGSGGSNLDCPDGWVDLIVDYAEYMALRRNRDPRWQEAWEIYKSKRFDLINSNDYLPINRELVVDPYAGYVPLWHLEGDWD